MKNKIDNLLARYFGGNASDKDMLDLEQWISLSSENQSYFDQMSELYVKLGGDESLTLHPNKELAKEKFRAYMSLHKVTKPKKTIEIRRNPFYKSWMFQAASFTLFIMLSFSVWRLYLSNSEIVLATKMTSKQEVLPDQTQVHLSKNSKVTYSSNYSDSNKIIKLEGEANFKVGHTGKGRLQVIANNTYIEDIGTVFKVTAYPDNNFVSVKVQEGEVHFYSKDNKGVRIKANGAGIYDKQTKTFKVLAQKVNKLKEGYMHIDLQEIELRNAIDIISNAYKVDIKLNEKSIGEKKITVNFDGEDVNVVLQIITQTLNLELDKGDNGYLLKNKNTK